MRISEAKRQARLCEWSGHIQDQQNSGLTIKDWCAQQGFSVWQYYYWLRVVREDTIKRYERESQELSLVKVDPAALPTQKRQAQPPAAIPDLSESAVCQSTYAPGVVIRYGSTIVEMPSQTQMAAIAELLKALSVP